MIKRIQVLYYRALKYVDINLSNFQILVGPNAKGIPRSSSIYQDIAERVSVNRCQDPSFLRFKTILQNWFTKNVV